MTDWLNGELFTKKMGKEELILTPLVNEHAKLIYSWRNDPYIVARSTLQKQVTWEEHTAWIQSSISSETRKVYVLYVGDIPIGQVRFDFLAPTQWVISIYLIEAYTRQGLGVQALKISCDYLLSEFDNHEIYAFVRKDNTSGQKGFIKAGFKESSHEQNPKNHSCLKLSRNEK